MKRNKIDSGWNAVPNKKSEFQKTKVSWTEKYEIKHYKENTVVSKIIKSIIRFSLFFSFNRKNLSKSKINSTVNNTYEKLSSSTFKFIPSSVAFYLFLSVIPVFIIVMSITAAFNDSWYLSLSNEFLPQLIPGIQNMFTKNLDLKSSNIVFIVLFIASSIWFASKGINKFRDSFSELYGYDDKKNFIVKRLKSILIVVFISLYFSLVAIAWTPLMQVVKNNITNHVTYEFLFYFISFIYIVIFGYIGIGLLFKYISPIRLKWSYLNLGILTSLIPIVLFLLLFSTICKFLNYEKFGAIGSFLYLILFMLYISYFLHAGIIINASYYRTNVLQNVVVKKSLISKKIIVFFKNIWHKIRFYRH